MNKRLKRLAIVSIAFTLLPILVKASDCENIRLDLPGSVFDKIPVYNQLDFRGVDANICYAIASAQLVDEYRYRKGQSIKQITSPLSLAIGYKESSQDPVNRLYNFSTISTQNITDSILGGGYIDETIWAANRVLICDQNVIENDASLMEAESFTKSSKMSAQQFVEDTLLDQNTLKIKSFRKSDFLALVKTELNKKCEGHVFALDEIRTENLSSGYYLEDLAKLMKFETDATLTAEQKLTLRKDFARKYDKVKIVKSYREQVNKLLAQKIPVGIAYFMKVLQKKSGSSDFASHASIITGQRKNPKTQVCELLVRDSYGSSCQDKNGVDRYNLPCENGSVWVPADTLLAETPKISWIP